MANSPPPRATATAARASRPARAAWPVPSTGSTARSYHSPRPAGGAADALEHAELRWVRAEELEDLDWIAADRPLLPAVRALLARLSGT